MNVASISRLSKIGGLSLREEAHLRLRDLILEGSLVDEDQLVIEQLAARLGISRTPIREAIAMLEKEGLVRTARNRGTFVVGITEEMAGQVMQVREALEAMAVRLAVTRLPEDEFTRLERLFDTHKGGIERGDMESDRVLNVSFHGTIAAHSGNVELAGLITNYEEKFNRYLIVTKRRTDPRSMVASYQEHLGILQALRKRDAAEAERLMVDHLRASSARGSSVYRKASE